MHKNIYTQVCYNTLQENTKKITLNILLHLLDYFLFIYNWFCYTKPIWLKNKVVLFDEFNLLFTKNENKLKCKIMKSEDGEED